MSKIEWTADTWNPVRGCSRVSEGCDNCYAIPLAHRFSGKGGPYVGLTVVRGGRVDWSGYARLVPEMLDKPMRWKRPRRIFVNSMSDLFHSSLSNQEIAAVFGVMAGCPQHTFQVLTKRPGRARRWFSWVNRLECCPWTECHFEALGRDNDEGYIHCNSDGHDGRPWPLPNVHLGTSIEDQKTADERVPELLRCPAAVRWLSAEPLLGPIDLKSVPYTGSNDISWVVVGGESGAGARQCDVEWIRSIVLQCKSADVPVFVKQLGAAYVDSPNGVGGFSCRAPSGLGIRIRNLKDRKGGDPSEWPDDLRVREWPRA